MTSAILNNKDSRSFVGASHALKKALKSVRNHYAQLLEVSDNDRVVVEDVSTVLDEINVFESIIDGREDVMRRTVFSRVAEYSLVDNFGLAVHTAFTGHSAVKTAVEAMKSGGGTDRFHGAALLLLYARAANACYSLYPDFISRLRLAEDIRLLHLMKCTREGLTAEDVLCAVYPSDPMDDFSKVDADTDFESLRQAIHKAFLGKPQDGSDNVIKLKGASHMRLILSPGRSS